MAFPTAPDSIFFYIYAYVFFPPLSSCIFVAGEGLPHTAGTHLVPGEGMAVFVLGQAEGTLTVVRMSDPPLGVTSHTIKNTSIVNRFFTGFVPGMFRLVIYLVHTPLCISSILYDNTYLYRTKCFFFSIDNNLQMVIKWKATLLLIAIIITVF